MELQKIKILGKKSFPLILWVMTAIEVKRERNSVGYTYHSISSTLPGEWCQNIIRVQKKKNQNICKLQ